MNLGLLNNAVVSTYMKTSKGMSSMKSFPLNQLLTLDLQSSDPTMVYFTPKRALARRVPSWAYSTSWASSSMCAACLAACIISKTPLPASAPSL